jgi:RNA polymerase sigma factor (TIGR02999 family)
LFLMPTSQEITGRLRLARKGDRAAFDEVFSLVYGELHRLAQAQRRRWDGDTTLDTTSLVHEVYLKLVPGEGSTWEDRGHFLAVAAKAMRHLLVNYSERQRAAKRGGGARPLPIDEFNPVSEEVADDVVALHESLERLEEVSPRQVSVVEHRFFLGLSVEETGMAIGISPSTVKRDWVMASAWLYQDIRTTLL